MNKKNPWLAALLSFLTTGLGQFYAGYPLRGLRFFGLYILAVLAAGLVASTFLLFFLVLFLAIGFILYQMFDAAWLIKTGKEHPIKFLNKWYIYVAIISFRFLVWDLILWKPTRDLLYLKAFYIPTPSMEPTLQVGDYMMSKQILAASIQQGDVIIFQFSSEDESFFIKRCVGLPGDTLEVKNSLVYQNGKFLDDTTSLQFTYYVKTADALDERSRERLNLDKYFSYHSLQEYIDGGYLINTTPIKAQALLKEIPFVEQLVKFPLSEEGERHPRIFPYSVHFDWNERFYGPVVVPKKGMRINLDIDQNYALYIRLIEQEHGQSIEGGNYTFKKNYYFMMGDNRDNSLDSRFQGFVPEDLIKAKALYLFWSNDWGRVGETIK